MSVDACLATSEHIAHVVKEVQDEHSRIVRAIPALVGEVQDSFLDRHSARLAATLDPLYARLSAMDIELSARERAIVRGHHRAIVQPFFLQSPLVRRLFDQPRGVPCDYITTEALFDNVAQGDNAVARVLSSYVLGCGPARAFRSRAQWVQARLKPGMRVLSFGCGSERALRGALVRGARVDVTIADGDADALVHARQKLPTAVGRLQKTSVAEVLSDPGALDRLGRQYDLIVLAGVLDTLADAQATKLVFALSHCIVRGGEMLVTNTHTHNPWRTFLEHVCNWTSLSRSSRSLCALMPQRACSTVMADESNTNLFLAAKFAL